VEWWNPKLTKSTSTGAGINRTQFQSSILVIFQKLVNKEKVSRSRDTRLGQKPPERCFLNLLTCHWVKSHDLNINRTA